MKKLLLLALLLLPLPAKAQTFSGRSGGDSFVLPPFRFCFGEDDGGQTCVIASKKNEAKLINGTWDFRLTNRIVSTLPPAGGNDNLGRVFRVTDAQSATDCVVGGSIASAVCYSDGVNWIPLGGGGGGVGTVGPGTPGTSAIFATSTTIKNGSCTDDLINPLRCPNGNNSANGGNEMERVADTGGAAIGQLICRSQIKLGIVCPAGTTTGVLGVAKNTVSAGGTIIICFAATCNPLVANNTTTGHWLIPSASVAGDVDDTGSAIEPTGNQHFLAESTVTAGQTVQTTLLSPDNLNANGSSINGIITPCSQDGVAYYSAAGTANTLNCIPSPVLNGNYQLVWKVVANTAVVPVPSLAGIAGRNVSGASDTILYSDRVGAVTYTGATAHAVTVPQAGSAGFTSNPAFRTRVTGIGNSTFTPTTSTVNGNATMVQVQGQVCTWYSLDGSNYVTDCVDQRRTCSIVIGADNGPGLADADIGPQGSQCFVSGTGTIIEVTVKADGGTPTALPRKEHGVTNTSLLSGALSTAASGAIACANVGGTLGLDGVTTCSNALSVTSLAAGDFLGITSGVAGGTAKRMNINVTWVVVN